MNLFLASASPRRKELLAQAGYTFKIVKPNIEECRKENELPYQYVERLSYEKAIAGLKMLVEGQGSCSNINCDTITLGAETVVLGADTIVVLAGQVLEKPVNYSDAKRMLLALSGKKHQVMTALTAVSKRKHHSKVVVTDVWFKTLTEKEINDYWETGEPHDKAGSYGIQGIGGRFVSRIEGSYYAVVGLPLFETDSLLQAFFEV